MQWCHVHGNSPSSCLRDSPVRKPRNCASSIRLFFSFLFFTGHFLPDKFLYHGKWDLLNQTLHCTNVRLTKFSFSLPIFFTSPKSELIFPCLVFTVGFLSLCFFPSSSGSIFHFRLFFFFFLFSRRRALQPNLLISQCVRSRPGSNLRDERQQPRFWPKEADKRVCVLWRIVRY